MTEQTQTGRIDYQGKAQLKIKSPREEVDAASATEMFATSSFNDNFERPGMIDELVGRVKWRLARMEDKLSRGEVSNGGMARRIEVVKAKLRRFKYLTWLKNRHKQHSAPNIEKHKRCKDHIKREKDLEERESAIVFPSI